MWIGRLGAIRFQPFPSTRKLRMRLHRTLCCLLSGAIALTGCHSSAKAGSPPVKAPSAGGPPAGGWPQPEKGRMTEKMCGLLTEDDYAKFGHMLLGQIDAKRADTGNAVSCLYQLSDSLSLDLQPTAASAALRFAADLKDHKDRFAEEHSPSVLAENVLSGADESWFDYSTDAAGETQDAEHEIEVRRGSLLVDIVLAGMKEKDEKDPRTVLTGLAGLVLQRIPDVGKTASGSTHQVTYTITGVGKARQINYGDPSTQENRELKGVKLPWSLTKPIGFPSGQQQMELYLSAVMPTHLITLPVIRCRISVDGKTVADERGSGAASCTNLYNLPSTG